MRVFLSFVLLLVVPVWPVSFRMSNPFLLICVFFFRVEFIKGDPYIRDMKNTAYV